MENQEDPIGRFLAQPPEEGTGDREESRPAPHTPHRGAWGWLTHFLFEKEPSAYSSITPRRADGKRTKPFFFNGSGWGR